MTLEGARKRLRSNPEGVSHDAEIMERLKNIRNMLAALKAEMGDDTEVIEIDEEEINDSVEVAAPVEEPAVEAAPAVAISVDEEPAEEEVAEEEAVEEEEPTEEAVVEEEAVEEKPAQKKEKLAEFRLESQPAVPAEEPHKKSPRTAKVGTLIGGNLFSPEDIRLAVAKKNSKEAKSQVIEQTLF